jgi:signal transduction histidine kinase
MAILIVLQNSGLAAEIGNRLRRDAHVAKVCPSVCGSEFLKEFPDASLIITDLAPPVLKLLPVGGTRLLNGSIPVLLLASPGHCSAFTKMLRAGTDRCLALEWGMDIFDAVSAAVRSMAVPQPAGTEAASEPVCSIRGQEKRIAADSAHEHRADRFTRRVMSRQVRFVSNIAHDLRTPLTAISEFAELMQSGLSGDMNEQQRRYVGIIERCCGEAARMVYDLLDGARLQTGHIHPHRQAIDLGSVFTDVLDSLEPAIRQSGIVLKTETAGELPRLFADRDMLGRIIGNLISNAIKFSPPSSTVTVRAERFSVSLARISVIDSGSGIASQDLRRIFHRFEQGSNPGRRGVGLGLAIVRELVKLHGGRVTVESTPGRGSRFHFTLPLFLPTAIVRRQLASQSENRNGPATAWSITVHDAAKYDAIHRLMSASVRSRDLILPEDSRRYLLVITHSKQPERYMERLRQQISVCGGSVSVTKLSEVELPSWLAAVALRSTGPAVPASPVSIQRAG